MIKENGRRRMSRNLGIIGAGNIAEHMAETVNGMEGVNLYGIAARDYTRAEAFAEKYHVTKAYGSYEELVKDDDIDLVYIATPHSHHYEHMKLCLNHGKNVLSEKAFTANFKEAEEIVKLAKEKNLFVAEAIWTRYMPSRRIIDDILKENLVGKISTVTANLSYDVDKKERLIRPELAGGALLDIGIYGLNFFVMHLGKDIERIESSVVMTDTGVDGQEVITIIYNDGTMAVTTHSIYGRSDRKGIFTGEKGYIIVENINNPSEINVYDSDDKLIAHREVPRQITGYEYQVEECFERIENGKKEASSMPLEETLYMMKMMEDIKNSWKSAYSL